MQKIAILPLRAGSKSIKGKNKKKMLGRPLFSWTLGEAIFSDLDAIYVFTDDDEIIDYVNEEYQWATKIKTVRRSTQSATDSATTESAMIELVKENSINYGVLCLLQATSPLTTRNDINKVLEKIDEGYDSALTTVETKRFFWNNTGESLNYNPANRPMRQNFKGVMVENGAVYATTKQQFEKSGIRIGGKIAVVEMPEETYYEIDEPADWVIIEQLLARRLKEDRENNTGSIKLIVTDVDGVLTNGKINYTDAGELCKAFSYRDGMGFAIAKDYDIEAVVMTTESSEIVARRMEKLKINYYMGVKDKYTKLQCILKEKKLGWNQVAYIGDDINDLVNIMLAGIGVCPADAAEVVQKQADIILKNNGGDHAFREAVEAIINR